MSRSAGGRSGLSWASRLSAALVLAALLALVAGVGASLQGLGGQATAAQSQEYQVPADQACSSDSLVRTMAVKLAPGAKLVPKADGTLAVAQEWDLARGSFDHLAGFPLRETEQIPQLGVHVLELTDPESAVTQDAPRSDKRLADLARALQLTHGVVWAEVSSPVEACVVPNDPYYSPGQFTLMGQWGLARTGFPAAWDVTAGSNDVVVAVLDTGLNRDIPDFAGRIVSPYDVVSDSSAWPAWADTRGHGTAVAGVAGAEGNNSFGIAGAAWKVGIMPVKVYPQGASTSDTSLLVEGIIYAVEHGADVINISLEGPGTTQALNEGVEYALGRDVTIVAAAGNDNSQVAYPAALPGVIAVGATDSSDTRWVEGPNLGSNMGSELDVMAPGKDILSYFGSSATPMASWKGTSFAAPLVSGLVALMRTLEPTLVPAEITEIITRTANDLGTSGWDREYGWGLVDATEALSAARDEGPDTGSRFPDVSADTTPYWREIEHLAALGIVVGDCSGYFHPDYALTRQQFAKVIVLALGYPVSTADECPFVDVERSSGDEVYPDHYIAVAFNQDIMRGTDAVRRYFSPYGNVTRAQMITVVARALALKDPPPDYPLGFSPGQFPSMEHYDNARRAAYAGLLDGLVGVGDKYAFGEPATRDEVCALTDALLRYLAHMRASVPERLSRS